MIVVTLDFPEGNNPVIPTDPATPFTSTLSMSYIQAKLVESAPCIGSSGWKI